MELHHNDHNPEHHQEQHKAHHHKQNRRIKKKLAVIAVLVTIIIMAFPGTSLDILKQSADKLTFGLGGLEQTDGRTNLLLLGIGGVEHDGGELTDTIILASINHSRKSVEMISLPRDLMVKNPYRELYKPEYVKVNMMYWLGKKKDPSNRFQFLNMTIEDITQLPVHYSLLVDFNGFQEVIDALGGVVVEVDKSFTDREYPNSSYGYMTINFEEGLQMMSGNRALQYVRSRHGNNGEEGDFARSRRQEKIINAVKERALSAEFLTSPKKLEELYETVRSNFITNIGFTDVIALAKFGKDVSRSSISKLTIQEGDDGLLHVPLLSYRKQYFGGVYGLLPDGGSYAFIHQLVKAYLKDPSIMDSDFTIEILNGTRTPGVAGENAVPLKSRGYKIQRIGNTYRRKKYDESIIVDRTGGLFPDKIAQIRTLTGIHSVTTENIEPNLYRADITVIIGDDY